MKTIITQLKDRWHAKGGYGEILRTAIPLILSTGAWSIQHFVDRMFLSWYSPDAMAASMPAGILNFTILCFFFGICSYSGTFVAQYFGSKQYDKIGAPIWQGFYVALFGAIILLCCIPLATPLFNLIGHDPAIRKHEIIYFRILCLGAFGPMASAGFGGFFSGRGQNWPIMLISSASTVINIVFNYILIFGKLGLEPMGIAGAGYATLISGFSSVVFYLFLMAKKNNDQRFHSWRSWRINFTLLKRLLRFGLPNGVQFFIDIAGFTLFILFIGRIGNTELAASNIAFNINTLAFMPMIGAGIAISMLVGRYLGENKPSLAQKSVYSGFHLTFCYMGLIALLYLLFPSFFLFFYEAQADPEQFQPISDLAKVLLRFVAIYSLFDTMTIIFASAIKGAGDTRFAMWLVGIFSLCFLVLPAYVALFVLKKGIFIAWFIVTAYVSLLGFGFFIRFIQGKWKSMRVIEEK